MEKCLVAAVFIKPFIQRRICYSAGRPIFFPPDTQPRRGTIKMQIKNCSIEQPMAYNYYAEVYSINRKPDPDSMNNEKENILIDPRSDIVSKFGKGEEEGNNKRILHNFVYEDAIVLLCRVSGSFLPPLPPIFPRSISLL